MVFDWCADGVLGSFPDPGEFVVAMLADRSLSESFVVKMSLRPDPSVILVTISGLNPMVAVRLVRVLMKSFVLVAALLGDVPEFLDVVIFCVVL